MTVYHAAYAPDGHGDRLRSFASEDKQEVFRKIWDSGVYKLWDGFVRHENDEDVEVIKEALEDDDYATAVRMLQDYAMDAVDGFRYRFSKTEIE